MDAEARQIDGDDDRLIREDGLEARVAKAIRPVLKATGHRLVRVRFSGQSGLTLQIMAERLDGSMTVEDCEEVSRSVSPLLDVEDLIDKAYHLEVSSPGIDRPLVRKADFETWRGHLVKVETSVVVAERKRFRGRIAAVEPDAVTVERDQPAYGEPPAARIPFEAIAEARLILTDELIREALSKDNRARKEARRRRGEPEQSDDNEIESE